MKFHKFLSSSIPQFLNSYSGDQIGAVMSMHLNLHQPLILRGAASDYTASRTKALPSVSANQRAKMYYNNSYTIASQYTFLKAFLSEIDPQFAY